MAKYYIKDVIKSMLNIDGTDSEQRVASTQSLSQIDPTDEEMDSEKLNSDAMGVRSPNVPMRGRSIKEFEEHLNSLKKENFNLKLRIYFLEERMGGNFTLDQESAVKKNIELMVDVETLRKELDEKQQLLCQAVKAMELEEEEHRKDCDTRDKEISNLKEHLEEVQQQFEIVQDEVRSHGDEDKHVLFNIEESSDLIKELENKIVDLQTQLYERDLDGDIKCCEHSAKVKQLETALAEKDDKIKLVMNDLDEKVQSLSATQLQLESATRDLKEKQSEVNCISTELKEKKSEMEKIQIELDNVKTEYEDNKLLLEQECKKNEKSRIVIANRNNKISELETNLEYYKGKVGNMERKLESAQNEVTSKTKDHQPASNWSPRKLLNTDVDLITVRGSSASPDASSKTPSRLNLSNSSYKSPNCSDKTKSTNYSTCNDSPIDACTRTDYERMKEELVSSKKLVKKFEIDLRRSCQIIQNMLDNKRKHEKEIQELQRNLHKRDSEIQELNEKIQSLQGVEKKSLQKKISEMNLSGAAPASDTELSMTDGDDPQELIAQYRKLTEKLDMEKQILLDTLNEKNAQMESLQNELKLKENVIIDMEFELFNLQQNPNDSDDKTCDEKDLEIKKLEKELAKRNCDLQGVVNKELWSKNREIEKFTLIFDTKNNELNLLKKDIENKENKLKLLMEKISELEGKDNLNASDNKKPDEKLEYYLCDRVQFVNQIQLLKDELQKHQDEESTQMTELRASLEKSELLRVETNQICTALSTRLEEIAYFLDSLLKQKSVLGLLGNKQSKLREIVNQSLDISRMLSFNLSMNPDESLLQLSKISELLNSTHEESDENKNGLDENSHLSILPESATLTYQNHLNHINTYKNEKEEVITVLRQQLEKMKQEIEIRDHELAKCNCNIIKEDIQSPDNIIETLMSDKLKLNLSPNKSFRKSRLLHLDNSDSESWSEPDRSVSKDRIGLDIKCLKPVSSKSTSLLSESTECQGSLNKIRSPSKRLAIETYRQTIQQLNEQIGELEVSLQHKDEELISIRMSFDSTKQLCEEYETKYQTQIIEVSKLLTDKKELEDLLVDSEARKEAAEMKISELEKTVDELQANKATLIESMDSKSKTVQNRINELEIERSQALEGCKATENQLSAANRDIENANMQLKHMEKKIEELEFDYLHKVKTIELENNSEIQRLNEAAFEMRRKYETEYVKRKELDRLVKVVQELKSIQEILHITEDKVQRLEAIENDLRDKLQETEINYTKKVNELRIELDQATLQCSEAILEKTRVEDQKAQIDMEFKDLQTSLIQKIGDYKRDFASLQDKFQKQISTLEMHKSKLQVKNSELESTNAELLNKLIRLQSGRMTDQAHSAPTSPISPIVQMYLTKNISELTVGFASDNSSFNYKPIDDARNAEIERHHANSSPDLGIESDHGRFSSLEANINNVRPFLQPLEVSQCMNNMLEKSQHQLVGCNNEQCCVKVKDVQDENNQLRRKLIKSNKLLEDTLAQLAKANERKLEVEKNICKQIYKTSQVLKKAKANLDSGSETDIRK